MGYRLYATLRGVGGQMCFGKLFGYRSEASDRSSKALHYLLDNSDMIETYFEDKENKTEIAAEVASMFDSDFRFRIKMVIPRFLCFIMLYSIEAAERWKAEGETPERYFGVMTHMLNLAVSLVSQKSDYYEVILEWG